MATIDFIRTLSDRDDPDLQVWSNRLLSVLAERTLHLARYIDRLPPDLQEEYWAALGDALAQAPKHFRLEITPALWECLAGAPAELKPMLAHATAPLAYAT